MKKQILILAAFVFGAVNLPVMACTNFIVTKGASKDGSCMVTYAADSHTLYGELYYFPAATYPEGTLMDVYEWDTGKKMGKIAQVTKTYSVIGNMNEHQLAIAETTYGGREDLVDPTGIIDYGSLIYITLQRAKNAREAIKIMSELVEKYGYASSGESLSIVDPNEAWIMEIIGKGTPVLDDKGKTVKGWTKGAVWVARRIPDGYISGHANQARITTFPLSNGKTSITSKEISKIFQPEVDVIYAHDVISFARLRPVSLDSAAKHGYAKSPKLFNGKDEEFSFCDTYAPLDFSGARACEARVWAGFYRCNPDLMLPYEKYARGEDLKSKTKMPLWIKPVNKLGVQDVMNLMRDHYEGTSMDMTKDIGAGPFNCPYRWRPMGFELDGKKYIHERATATQQTGFSFVAQCRSWLPDWFGGILWFGVDDAASCCYMPMFCGINKIPEELKEGNGSMAEYSPTAAFWTFTKVSNFAYSRYKDMIVPIVAKQSELENRFVDEINKMEKQMTEMCKNSPDQARQMLTQFSTDKAKMTCQEWNKLFEYLLVKYHDGNVKKEKDGKFLMSDTEKPQIVFPDQPKYSEKWYRAIVNDCGDNIRVPEE